MISLPRNRLCQMKQNEYIGMCPGTTDLFHWVKDMLLFVLPIDVARQRALCSPRAWRAWFCMPQEFPYRPFKPWERLPSFLLLRDVPLGSLGHISVSSFPMSLSVGKAGQGLPGLDGPNCAHPGNSHIGVGCSSPWSTSIKQTGIHLQVTQIVIPPLLWP